MSVEKVDDEVKNLITRLYYECMSTYKSVQSNNTVSKRPIANEQHNVHFAPIISDESDTQLYCPLRFDGYSCWPRTKAGVTAMQNCPAFVTGFDHRLFAYKQCLNNGTWFTHPDTQVEWSNYTTCVDVGDFEFRQLVNDLYVQGYTISLVTLIISLGIFFSFRSLRCTRIRIHVQLFISLALSCMAWILWYKLIIERPDAVTKTSVWCVSLHLILHYLMLANYFWMFCEGLHLHLVLVVVFVKDSVAMRWFLSIGWLAPIALIILYAFIRGVIVGDSSNCWMEDSHTMWILLVPVCISLAASMIFLINVVRVLVKKLHPCSTQPAPIALKKAARATLILVPLFGLHNILLPFRPEAGAPLDKFYQIVSALLLSLQGACVSCLFCFINHDVLHAMRSLLNRFFPRLMKSSYKDSMGGAGLVGGLTPTHTRDVVV